MRIKRIATALMQRLKPNAIPELTSGPTGASMDLEQHQGPRLLTGSDGAEITISTELLSSLAIMSDGQVLVSQRRMGDAGVQHALKAARSLLRTDELRIKHATPKEILAAYGSQRHGRNEVTAALATFLSMIEDAADAGVNEIIVVLDGDYASVVHMRNSRKELVPSAGMHKTEALNVFYAAFNNSNNGDQHPQFQEARDATFTTRALLPENVFGLRIHWEPETNGIVMNVRIAYWEADDTIRGIESLKQPAWINNMLNVGIHSSGGIIVIAGQPEMGKSRTQAVLLDAKARNIMADGQHPIMWHFEEPIELVLRPGLYGDLGRFKEEGEALVEAVLARVARLACNAIKLQETRTTTQAKILFGLANMGIFACSTVHTGEVVDIPARFIDLGVETRSAYNAKRYILLVAQRLVPVLCPNCSRPAADAATKAPEIAAILQGFAKARIDIRGARVQGQGCAHCAGAHSGRGVIGRQLLMEAYRPTADFMDALSTGDHKRARSLFLRETEGHSLRLKALEELREGRLSLYAVQEIADPTQIREDLDLQTQLSRHLEVA